MALAKDTDTVIGSVTVAAGATGLTLQVVLEYASFLIIFINLILAIGGLYLLWLRIRRARAELHRLKNEDTSDD